MIKPNYKNNIINVTNSILNHYNCFISYPTLPLLDQHLKNNYNHVAVILLDGLGINIIGEHLNPKDGLYKNIKTTLHSVFPPTTVAATNAFLSGKPPFATGFVGWSQYNPFDNVVEVVFLNEDYYHFENKLETSLLKDHLYYDNFIKQVGLKNPDIHTEVLMPPFDLNNGYETFDHQLDRLLMLSKGKKSLTYTYWTEPDATIHEYGTKSSEVKEMVQSLNKSYERFLKEIDEDVLVIVIADHGFTDVVDVDLFNYQDIVNTFRLKPAVEPRALTFYIKEDQKEQFEFLFDKYFSKDFILLTREQLYHSELLGYGVKHPLLDTFVGDYMAISVSNKMFKLKKESSFKAHHAGLTTIELEVPLIINK